MIGKVIDLEAVINIQFHLPNSRVAEEKFVIDTGFTGSLTLPLRGIAELGLPFRHNTSAYLADHSEIIVPVFDAMIIWQGNELEVKVMGTGERPLLGTALLAGFSLFAEFQDKGEVEVRAI